MLTLWQALRYEDVLRGGRTKPLVLNCIQISEAPVEGLEDEPVPERRERRSFVVKALGLPEVDEVTVSRELLGNILARHFGVDTPEPALIEITDDFASAINPALRGEGLEIKAGIAAGCDYLRGGLASIEAQQILAADVSDATLLYAFDLFVQNPDRIPTRPNCAVLGNRLVAYDFDMAFSFLYALGQRPQPWEVSRHGINLQHLFRARLKAKSGLDWKPSSTGVAGLTDDRLDAASSWIPERFKEKLKSVKEHFEAVRQHLSDFEVELQRSLA